MCSLFDRLPLVLVVSELCTLCSQRDQLALAACNRTLYSLLRSDTAVTVSSTLITGPVDSDARRAVRLTLQRSVLRILTGAKDERSTNLEDDSKIPGSNLSSQQLSLWLRGPGYRRYHGGSIEVASNLHGGYDLFEPGWLGTTSSHGIVISRAIGAAQSHFNVASDKQTNTGSSEILAPFLYTSASPSEGIQDPTAGSIFASTFANSASNTHLQSMGDKTALSTSSYSSPAASISSTWSLLNRWSLLRLRQFLYSIEKLSFLRDALHRHGAVCNFGCPQIAQAAKQENLDDWSETTRRDMALLGEPIPFLLPWPYAIPPSSSSNDTTDENDDDATKRGGADAPPRLELGAFTREEEQHILNAWSSGRSKEEWDLSLMCCDLDYEKLQPPFVPMLPQHHPDLDYDQMSQLLNQYITEGFEANAGMEVLSGIVHGNAWVCSLTNVENVFDHRIQAETKWVAKKINQLLGITPPCQGAVFPQHYAAGFRDVDAACDEYDSNKKKTWNQLFLTKDASNAEASKPSELHPGLPQEVAEQVRKLLPSSMLVNVSSEHVLPWPCLLVAPVAPGFIGGFMSAATLLEPY